MAVIAYPPRGSRSDAALMGRVQPALREAVRRFEGGVDRRATVAELVAIGHGIDCGRKFS